MFTAFNNLTESQHQSSSLTLFLRINRPEENLAKKQHTKPYQRHVSAINFSILISNYKGCEMRRQMTAEIAGRRAEWRLVTNSGAEVHPWGFSLDRISRVRGCAHKMYRKKKKMRWIHAAPVCRLFFNAAITRRFPLAQPAISSFWPAALCLSAPWDILSTQPLGRKYCRDFVCRRAISSINTSPLSLAVIKSFMLDPLCWQ